MQFLFKLFFSLSQLESDSYIVENEGGNTSEMSRYFCPRILENQKGLAFKSFGKVLNDRVLMLIQF